MELTQKQKIRKSMREHREAMDTADVQGKSLQIVYGLLDSFKFNGKKILLYLPKEGSNEVNTWPLLDELLVKSGTKLYAPKYLPEKKTIAPVRIKETTEFELDEYSVSTPIIEDDTINIEQVIEFDFIIIPLIAFDLLGNRIGYGNGAYDKFLSSQKKSKKVGLGYRFQLTNKPIETEHHDIKLNYVVTEEKIYKFR